MAKSAPNEVTTRIGEENVDLTSQTDDTKIKKIKSDFDLLPEDSDNESEELKKFNVPQAWEDLFKLPGYTLLMLNPFIQKKIGCEVGVNVSQEFPWRQLPFKDFVHCVLDNIEGGTDVQNKFIEYAPEELVLIGYCPTKTQNDTEIDERDPFITYSNHYAARKASQIIKNIQTYERWVLNKKLIKKSRPWKSCGSHKEVQLSLPLKKLQSVDVELQSIYPLRSSNCQFDFRLSSDVRDGYVELLAGEKKFENVLRKRINIGIQSAPNRLPLEQQTDPTFPTNAWSQYLYEIEDEVNELEVTSEEEEERKPGQKGPTEKLEPTPYEMSNQIQNLLNSLEFNQVDMYRNDYEVISSVNVPKYTNPFLEEILCFAEISKSLNRYVCAVDWYPTVSGLLTASYAFSTICTTMSVNDKRDIVAETIYNRHPVLMWSFSDSLNPKLQFESPQQITALSFCPYAPSILIGGAMNGQIILWDLQDRVNNLDYEEMLTTAQTKYRATIGSFLEWTQFVDEQFTVYPTVVSAIDTSQIGPITGIKWLPRNQTVTTDGRNRLLPKHTTRFFLTNSIDGTIAIWNLDINLDKKISASKKSKQPKQLCQSESTFKKFDRIFKPIFMITFPEPLSATICETAKFTYQPINLNKSHRDYSNKFPIQVKLDLSDAKSKLVKAETDEEPTPTGQPLISATLFGNISKYTWEGLDYDFGDPVNKENITVKKNFPNCHDGPIIALERNPHYSEIFASIGRYILAIWKDDFLMTPILWRKRPCELTSLKWSVERPSVLFLTRTDGFFEAWDILVRDDDACLADVLGGGIISTLSEHLPNYPKKILGIGDYNSSFRMIVLPSNFQNQSRNELENLKTYIKNEINRKKAIKVWEQNWLIKNADILEAKKLVQLKAMHDLELLKKEAEEQEAYRLKLEADALKKLKPPEKSKVIFDLPEKLEKKWDEQNLKRITDILMCRQMVDAEKLEKETVLEKKRLAYENSKRIAYKNSLNKIDEEVAAIRARILPIVKEKSKVTGMIINSVKEILQNAEPYDEIEMELNDFMKTTENFGDVSYNEFFVRGRKRRKIINKSLGGNMERECYYDELKLQETFSNFNLGLNPSVADFSDLDEIPVKE